MERIRSFFKPRSRRPPEEVQGDVGLERASTAPAVSPLPILSEQANGVPAGQPAVLANAGAQADSDPAGDQGSAASAGANRGRSADENPALYELKWKIEDVGRRIGAGSYGEVFSCTREDGLKVAVKSPINPEPFDYVEFHKEFTTTYNLTHVYKVENVAYCYGWMNFPNPNHKQVRPSIVTKLYDVDLGRLLSNSARGEEQLTPELRLSIACDIARGLQDIHKAGIAVQDLKPGNILLDENRKAVIADLGFARFEDQATLAAGYGTFKYMAPEMHELRRASMQAPANSDGATVQRVWDIWALGLVLWEIWTNGRHMWHKALMSGNLLHQAKEGPPACPVDMPADYYRVIARCVEYNAEERTITAEQVLRCLEAIKGAPRAPERKQLNPSLLGPEDQIHIGSGGLSDVYLCTYNGEKVAIKVPRYWEVTADIEFFHKEVSLWYDLTNKHTLKSVAKCYGWLLFTKRHASGASARPSIVTKLYRTDLKHLLSNSAQGKPRLTHELRLSIACDIARGLRDIHGLGIVMQDLKPGNILLDDKHTAVLADLGLARFSDLCTNNAGYGTPKYMAPEMFKLFCENKLGMGEHGGAAPQQVWDIWALGLVLWEIWTDGRHMLPGAPPPRDELPAQPEGMPREIYRLIKNCVEYNAKKRTITAEQVLKVLEAIREGRPPDLPTPSPPHRRPLDPPTPSPPQRQALPSTSKDPNAAAASALFGSQELDWKLFNGPCKQLDSNALGDVFQCTYDGIKVAVTAPSKPDSPSLLGEGFSKMYDLTHKDHIMNVPYCYGWVKFKNPKHPAASAQPLPSIVTSPYTLNLGQLLEKCSQGEVPLTKSTRIGIASDVTRGLMELHGLGISVKELMPGNVLLDRDYHAVIANVSGLTSCKPTRRYLPPERLRSENTSPFLWDIWALGLVLWEIWTDGTHMWPEARNKREQLQLAKCCQEAPASMPREYYGLLTKCLKYDYKMRKITAEAVFEELEVIKKREAVCTNLHQAARRNA